MSTVGKVQITIIYIAAADIVEEGQRVFALHADWIKRTHPREGELALVSYEIAQAPELQDPFDPYSDPTGNTMFVLNEIYETQAGLDEHWRMAVEEWEDMPALIEWSSKCKAVTAHNATVIQSL